MPLLQIIVGIAVAGFLLYLVNRFVPMEATIKNILNFVVIAALILWLLKVFGVLAYLSQITV